MRHIKKYENLKSSPYCINDFKIFKYWRYRNSCINIIWKLDKLEVKQSGVHVMEDEYRFLVLHLNVNKNKIDTIELGPAVLQGMIDLKEKNKILRPATPEEIEEFELKVSANKYNL